MGPSLQEFAAEIVFSILGHLPLKDLVAASGVSKQWRRLSKTPCLWRTVSFEGTIVDNLPRSLWKKLDRLGTTCLDFHACVDPNFSPRKAIPFICKRKNVVALYFGVIEKQDLWPIVAGMQQLKILHATCILPSIPSRELEILCDIGCFGALKSLVELKISSVYALSLPAIALSGGTEHLGQLRRMKKLVLTNFKNLDTGSVQFLGALQNLEHLELGSCSHFIPLTYVELQSLKNLKSLSLTEAHCSCHMESCECIGLLLQKLKR
ncbi:uncharacterized protein [Diadema antillarum]|uniref:uncharacterized protein n=1 Tax=Diadema antillarum TaxID=105358 RepID=UPI003A8B5DC3